MAIETVSQALRRAAVEAGCMSRLADHLRRKHRSRMTLRQYQARLHHELGDYDPHRFDPDDMPDLIEMTGGLDYVTPILGEARERGENAALRLRIRELEDQLGPEPERPGIKSVRRITPEAQSRRLAGRR